MSHHKLLFRESNQPINPATHPPTNEYPGYQFIRSTTLIETDVNEKNKNHSPVTVNVNFVFILLSLFGEIVCASSSEFLFQTEMFVKCETGAHWGPVKTICQKDLAVKGGAGRL